MKAKKSTVAVAAVLAFLAVGVAVLAILNGKDAKARKELLESKVFVIAAGGTEYEVTATDIEALGPREFQANYKKSGKAPETRLYSGVPFAAVLELKGVELEGIETATFSAADSYSSILSIAEALDEENCFIALDEGEEGPFRMIKPKDPFSQYWCKQLVKVILK